MKAKVAHLRVLIEKLLEKSGESPTPKGFQKIADAIDERVTSRYIYDYIFRRVKHAKESEALTLRDASLDALCEYVGYKNYKSFENALKEIKDPRLDTCLGSYYSYIRMNARNTVLLRSPARMIYVDGKYLFEQRGPRNIFQGEIKREEGCLFIHMQSRDGKAFFHTYKIGVMTSPKVIQGIFAGVSSSFDPIGGRVVLVKTDQEFSALKTEQIKSAAKDPSLKILLSYFRDFNANNLSINKTSAFSMDDLKN